MVFYVLELVCFLTREPLRCKRRVMCVALGAIVVELAERICDDARGRTGGTPSCERCLFEERFMKHGHSRQVVAFGACPNAGFLS